MSDRRRVGVIHIHSDYSHDGRDSLEMLRRWASVRGIGFVGLTDHAEDFEQATFARYQAECAALSDGSVQMLPGLEWRFAGYRGLHLLALGLSRWIEPRTPEEFLALTADNAQFTIVAHPILCDYQVPTAVLAGTNAIEVWNAGYNTRYLPDPRAIRLYQAAARGRPGLVATAGLDQHDCRNDREIRVRLTSPGGTDPLGALRAGAFENQGRYWRFGSRLRWGWAALAGLQMLRVGFDGVERIQDRASHALRRLKARR